MGGENFRKNLVTVPSCEVHNTHKSKDDEFLMVSLAGLIGNNSIGYRHRFGKVNRAIRRSSDRLLQAAFKSRSHRVLEVRKNHFIEVIWGTPDYDRLLVCFEHVARGIFFSHYGRVFDGFLRIYLGFVTPDQENAKTFKALIANKAEIDLKDKQKVGANQEVFYYQVVPPDPLGFSLLHLVFYGGVHVYVALGEGIKEKPFHLGWALMGAGIKTIFTVGDKEYVFNKKI